MEREPFRRATVDDIAALVSLLNTAFAMERDFIDRDRVYPDEVAAYMKAGSYFLVDGDAGAPAACMYLEPRGDRMYLGMLAVRPSQQGSGLGKRLMAFAEQHAAASGCRAIDLRVVDRRTELPPFYRALGFVDNGTEPLTDPKLTKPAHFIRMTKDVQKHQDAV
jgi:GNAT superfamily N-acetyltransferase